MSDSDPEDKTEEPTAKRLSDARQKGQVVSSGEIKTFFILMGGTIQVGGMLPPAFASIIADLKRFLALPHQVGADYVSLADFIGSSLAHVAITLTVPFLLMIIFGVASGLIQTGPLYAPEATKIKWSKINPMAGFKRLFSMNSLVEFLKSLVKMIVVGLVAFGIVKPALDKMDLYLQMPIAELLKETQDLIIRLMSSVVATMAVIGGLDYMHKRYEFYKSMRMSKEEVKDEHKQAEGDPKIKGKIRALRMQRAQSRMMASVPNADVVITNPTHYAVALEYKPETMQAPVIVALGMDNIALKIKELAEEHKVTIVSNPPLARALVDNGDLDQPIPVEQFQAVAEVISFVFRMRQQKGTRR